MATYNYNINLRVRVKDRELTRLEKRIQKMKNTTLNFKARVNEPKWNTNNSRRYWDSQMSYANRFDRRMQQTHQSMANFQRDYSRTARELNTSYSMWRDTNSLGRRMGVAREKGSRLMDVGAGVGTYIGLSSLKSILYDTPVRAETNKWLMSTMGDKTAGANQLYSTLDATTDRLPISMQSVAQPLYAFKAASGASAETIDKIIPQFANFGAVVQNMTGSTELAETAMMKLAYGLKGRYAALDQYGITEDALKRNGWNGDETDVEGYLEAVSKIVGNAEDSMTTFAGRVKLVEKSLARAGKQIWESGLGDALKGVLAGLSGVMDWNGGVITKFGVSVVAGTTALLGITAASGYLLQAIGSMTESFIIIKGAVSDAANSLAMRFGGTSKISALEGRLQRSKTPHYVAGIHDYNQSDLYYSGLSGRERQKIDKSKKRDKQFVKRYGWGAETERRIASVKADKMLAPSERKAQITKLKKSRLNELNQMNWYQRYRTAGRMNVLRNAGGAMRQGWNSGTGLNKITGAFNGLSGVFGSIVGVINPVNIALGAFAAGLLILGGVFAYAYTTSESFRQHVQRVGQLFMELMGTVGGLLGDVFQTLGLSDNGGLNGVIEVADKILSAIESGFSWLKGVLEGLRGKDSTAEKGYQDAYKTSKAAEDRIREAQKNGKSPKEYEKDMQTYQWAESRKKYFSQGGGYWDEKYKKLEEENPGWKIPRNAKPENVLRENAEYLKGDLGISGFGKPRTYDPNVAAKQKKEEHQTTGSVASTALGNLFGLPGAIGGKLLPSLTDWISNHKIANIGGESLSENNGQQMDSLSVGTLNVGNVSSDSMAQESATSNNASTGSGFNLTKGLTDVLTQNRQGLSIFEKDVDDTVQRSYGSMGNKISAQSPRVSQASSDLAGSAKTSLDTSMQGLSATAESEAGKISPAISSQSPRARSAAGQVGNAANSGFGNLTWSEKVKSEMQNIITAIQNALPSVASAAGSIASAMNTSHDDKGDFHSPGHISQRYFAEMGYIAGFIKSGTPQILTAIGNTVKQIDSAFNPFSAEKLNYPSFNDYIKSNPVDLYNEQVSKNGNLRTTKIDEPVKNNSTQRTTDNNNNKAPITFNINIGSVDSEDRVREIQEVIYETLFWNNETAGRNEPTPII